MLVAWFCNDNLRLPGSSLTWWRDCSAAPWEASPSSCRRRRERGEITTSPTCPSWRRLVERSYSPGIHNQEIPSQLSFSFCKFARKYPPQDQPISTSLWLKCLEACWHQRNNQTSDSYLLFLAGCYRGGRWDQGDVEDDGLPEHSWTPDDHQQQARI